MCNSPAGRFTLGHLSSGSCVVVAGSGSWPTLRKLISEDLLQTGRDALAIEARAILRAAERLDEAFVRAAEIIFLCQSKVIVSGIGKSGRIGEKIAATLCSTGTPAVFMHAGEAAHGDLGVYMPGDPTLMISKSGTTQELFSLLPV